MAVTLAQIREAIDEAEQAAITPADLVTLLDYAIAKALAVGGSAGVPSVTYTIGGHSRTLGLDQARALRDYYAKRSGAGGGFAFGLVEFG